MDKIHEINQKITDLKKKKEQLRLKAADAFYKRAERLLGEGFTTDFAFAILEAAWDERDETKMEVWRKKAEASFPKKSA